MTRIGDTLSDELDSASGQMRAGPWAAYLSLAEVLDACLPGGTDTMVIRPDRVVHAAGPTVEVPAGATTRLLMMRARLAMLDA